MIFQLTEGEEVVARRISLPLAYQGCRAFHEVRDPVLAEIAVRKIKSITPNNDGIARPYKSLMRKIAIVTAVL